MSDTPRTDAECFSVVSNDDESTVVWSDFARELERENVALRADVLEQCMLNAKGSEREYSLRGRIEQLERENAALRAADQIDISALRRENAALRSLIDDPNAMHSHYLRECNGWEVWQAERIHWFQDTVDKLERENAALKEELAPLRETVGVRGDAVTSRDDIAYWCKLMDRAGKADRLERENAALRADAERYRYIKNSETMEVSEILQSFCVSITFDLDAAIDAARKEAQPCQCTNGVIRSVGRDNDEVIEDCPDCSGSKEVQP